MSVTEKKVNVKSCRRRKGTLKLQGYNPWLRMSASKDGLYFIGFFKREDDTLCIFIPLQFFKVN